MPQINLGRVRGEDGGFGNVTSEYVNDGGEPNVEIIPSGEDSQKDFKFIFSNLVNNPIDSATIDRITNDQIANSSDTLTATGLTTLWGKIKSLFALKTHTHGTSGIDNKAITQAKIADGAVGETQLETSLRNSIFLSLIANHNSIPSQKPKTIWISSDGMRLIIETIDGTRYSTPVST